MRWVVATVYQSGVEVHLKQRLTVLLLMLAFWLVSGSWLWLMTVVSSRVSVCVALVMQSVAFVRLLGRLSLFTDSDAFEVLAHAETAEDLRCLGEYSV